MSNNYTDINELINVTGLWESKDKNGNIVWKGYFGGCAVFVFKNTYKEKSNQPDFVMKFGKRVKKEDGSPENITDNEDEVPF